MNIEDLRSEIVLLVQRERSMMKLSNVHKFLTVRKDLVQIEKITYLATASGNVGYFFKALNDAQIYSPTIIRKIMNRKTHGAYYRIVDKAIARIEEDSTYDIRKNNIYYKLAIVLNLLVKRGLLPIKDAMGNAIPVTVDNCDIDKPVIAIQSLLKELKFSAKRG